MDREILTTNDCIVEIMLKLADEENNNPSDWNDEKNWKRLYRKGSGENIIRKFKNKVTNREIYVKSNKYDIIEISDKEFGVTTKFEDFSALDNEFKDFPFSKKCEFATIYSKGKIEDWEINVKSPEGDDYVTPKDTRIGIINSGDSYVETIIVVTKDMKRFSQDDDFTTDQVIYFEVEKGKYYVPAQEPIDLIENDCVDEYVEDDAEDVEDEIKKYKLDHLLLSM